MSETTVRIAVAAVGIPLAVAAIYGGGWILAAIVGTVATLGALEFYRMAARREAQPLVEMGVLVTLAFVAVAALQPSAGPEWYGLVIALALPLIATAAIWQRGVAGQPLLSVATTLTGAIYTGALLAFGIFLRHLPGHESAWHGTALVFAPVLLTWASDTFAYFIGRAWGSRKLIPRVSPGKTVEGAIGAVIGSILVGGAYALVLQQFTTYRASFVEMAVFGLLVSVAAQLGDLVESLIKRDTGVKDSGTLLPGHGGALDRFDSLFFTLPLAYLFFRYWVGPGGPLG